MILVPVSFVGILPGEVTRKTTDRMPIAITLAAWRQRWLLAWVLGTAGNPPSEQPLKTQ